MDKCSHVVVAKHFLKMYLKYFLLNKVIFYDKNEFVHKVVNWLIKFKIILRHEYAAITSPAP